MHETVHKADTPYSSLKDFTTAILRHIPIILRFIGKNHKLELGGGLSNLRDGYIFMRSGKGNCTVNVQPLRIVSWGGIFLLLAGKWTRATR